MTFIDDVLAGKAKPEDIGDYIERWHQLPDCEADLHTWLGMTWKEYWEWGRNSSNLLSVLERRRNGIS